MVVTWQVVALRGLVRPLDRLQNRLLRSLTLGTTVAVDFGSGPGPALSVMFEEIGHAMELFDMFYAPDTKPLQQQYDFVTASEVVEHLHHPRRELDMLWSCLKSAGWLGIMTKRVIDREAFSRWHYKNDPTHVLFFSIETFRWLADHWGARLSVHADDVVLFEKTN